MASSINVNFKNFSQDIDKLRALSGEIAGMSLVPPTIFSSGPAPDEIKEIVQMYKTIHKALKELVGHTVTFMQNTAQSYANADKKAAARMDL